MLILVLGPNGSGKSAYAEQLLCRAEGSRFYVATMIPHGPQGAARVERHLAQRQGKGFTTLELPYRVGQADIPPEGAVLLEDVSNLLANRMFQQGGTAAQALEDIRALHGRCRVLVAVTISGLEADAYEGETRDYIHALHELNQQLLDMADVAVELREGAARLVKGEANGFV